MPRRLRRSAPLLGVLAAGLALAVPAPAQDEGSVTISGRAYAFNHMDTYIAGATIKVRELPKLSATTDANGDYVLEVPDDTNVTPYIEPPDGYNQIDLQTFHTRGEDIENANFQTPADLEYAGLAAILSVPLGPDGRPEQCAIVTTASARNVRGVPYETFHERTPHGVAGATAGTLPEVPGPTYFNEFVIPDPSETSTSEDGGIVWTEVPAGTYRIWAKSPTARFASFLATCENGRVVNANPPWGAYELAPGEEPLGAGIVASSVSDVRVKGSGADRRVVVELDSAEAITVRAGLRQDDKRIGGVKKDVESGVESVTIPVRESAQGKAEVRVKLRDAAADKVVETVKVKLPRLRSPMIDKIGKYLGGWLLFAGVILTAGPTWGDLPDWTLPVGIAMIVVGFVSLFYYGIRDQSRKWVAGDWVPATGEVQSQPFATSDDRELKLKLNCPHHGVYLTTIAIGRIGLYREFPKGTPVTAMVRSNDRRVVELETVGGESWEEILKTTDVGL